MSLDASFWVAVAFVVFVGILYRAGAFGTLIRSLDDRSEQIRKELEEAKALRVEAQRVLLDYQSKFKAAEAEADTIVALARTEAEHYTQSVQAEFDAFMVRRAMAEQRIAQAEATALAEVRGAAVDAAVKAAEIVLQSELKGSKGDGIISSGLKDVAANLR
jgi:F-type H+-transporting ATPase subunit b